VLIAVSLVVNGLIIWQAWIWTPKLGGLDAAC
jgi:hypothetical protein